MKTIKTYILILLAALFVKPADIMAQSSTPGFAPDGVVLNKNVVPGSQPNTYTINLEAFVTGSTTTTTTMVSAPTDFILVLDASSSMSFASDNDKRLIDAASAMINVVKNDAGDSKKHKISIIMFGYNRYPKNVDGYTTPGSSNFLTEQSDYTAVKLALTDDYAKAEDVVKNMNFPCNATATQLGMNLALLTVQNKCSTDRNQVVIVITDGLIQIESNAEWGDKLRSSGGGKERDGDFRYADQAMRYADQIKNMGIPIYVLDITGKSSKNRTNFLEGVSSDYTGMTFNSFSGIIASPSWKTGTLNDDGVDYYIDAANSDLSELLVSIAQSAMEGGASYQLTEKSSTVIDVVAPAFKLPDGASGSTITLQVAKCKAVKSNATSGAFEYTFEEPVSATSLFPNIEAKVGNLDGDKQFVEAGEDEDGKTVQVLGFDFSKNYVGEDDNDGVKEPRGYKLIISFPIEIDPRNPGGANVATNTEDSGIYFDEDGDGTYDQIGGFAIPHAKIPNLVIMKTGLHKGESATFYVYKLEKDGSKSQFPIVLVATQTSDDPSAPCYARAKIQEPGRYEVEESTWSWAYYISTRVKVYDVDDADKSDTPDATWNELGYGDKGAGYQAEIPWTFGTQVPEGTRSIIRNVNDFTEDPTQKGTLFSFTNEDKEKTPAHGEASKNNVFYESR